MNNTHKFTGKATAYQKARPTYAQAALDYLSTLGINSDTSVADVGSGTGIFSKQLLASGATVYGVEPNDDMRLAAEMFLKNEPYFHSIKGSAEDTTLPDKSVDFITAAQAFHWFDVDAFKKEAKRILKENGLVILVWNDEGSNSDYAKDFIQVLINTRPEHQNKTEKNTPNPIDDFFISYEKKEFENNLSYSKEDFILKNLSISAAPNENEAIYGAYIQGMSALFEKYQKNGKITIPNTTKVFVGKV